MYDCQKVALAYSGGLDTSVAIRWLLETGRAKDVIAVLVDVGQKEDLQSAQQKALKAGASQALIKDVRQEFVLDYVWKALKGNATYEFTYPLATAIARPLIAKVIAKVAQELGADGLAHGCTGKGNDQVRFELAWKAINSEAKIIAPAREWGQLSNRSIAIDYAQKHNIPVDINKKSPYSIDLNLWGRSVECGILEDTWAEPPSDAYALTISPEEAPDRATYIEIAFEEGIPVALDNVKLPALQLIEMLNEVAGKNGVGRVDQIENRLIGIKSREIYEAPAAAVLLVAHKELEYLVNPRDLTNFKNSTDHRYSQLIYDGLWFSPLREALDAFIQKSQERVTGTVRLKLFKGSCIAVGRKSPYSLYREDLATYGEGDVFEQGLAPGFIDLFGLGVKSYYELGEIK